MSKFLVIGNPIEHSLSPKLHNFWFKANNIQAIYDKKKLNKDEIHNFILDIKKNKIDGINVTVPFKKEVIQYLDDLSYEAKITQSVNTIYLKDNKIIGDNTDVIGFELAIKEIKFDIAGKNLANPIATILSLSMALKYSLDLDSESTILDTAVQQVLDEGLRTKDIMSQNMKEVSTSQMGDAIISKLK